MLGDTYDAVGLGVMAFFIFALPLSYSQRLLCGLASILCMAVAVWHCPYPICSACCVALPLSYLQRLLCGIAPILFAALAV